jgi:gas vesicle protein
MKSNWKTTTMILGTVIGALVGAGAAFLLIQKGEKENKVPKVTAQQGLQVGLSVLGVLRQISGFGPRS